MRKAILNVLLMVMSGSAEAAWTFVTNDNAVQIYADATTIEKSDDKIKVWTYYEYKTAQLLGGKQVLSSKALVEFKCKEIQARLLHLTTFSESNLKGDVITDASYTPPESDWSPIPPDSLTVAVLKFACLKQ